MALRIQLRPADDRDQVWALPRTASTAAMHVALATFAEECGIDARHRAVLVLEGAGWHTAGMLVVPDGIDLVRLPPSSPELQPVERVWVLLDEPIANADLDEVEAVLVTRCRVLREDRRTIRAHTR